MIFAKQFDRLVGWRLPSAIEVVQSLLPSCHQLPCSKLITVRAWLFRLWAYPSLQLRRLAGQSKRSQPRGFFAKSASIGFVLRAGLPGRLKPLQLLELRVGCCLRITGQCWLLFGGQNCPKYCALGLRMAPAPNTVQFEAFWCLPTAPALPTGEYGDFDRPRLGQPAGKPPHVLTALYRGAGRKAQSRVNKLNAEQTSVRCL